MLYAVVSLEGGGVEVERTYPVIVDYQAIRVKIATPAYRGNFYPGQNSDTVAGSVAVAVDGPVAVALEGPGFGKRSATLPPGGGAEKGVSAMRARPRTAPFL